MKKKLLLNIVLMVLPLFSCSGVAVGSKITATNAGTLLDTITSGLASNKQTKYTVRSYVSSTLSSYVNTPSISKTDTCYYDETKGFLSFQTIDEETGSTFLTYYFVKEASFYTVINNEYDKKNFDSTAEALTYWKEAATSYSPASITTANVTKAKALIAKEGAGSNSTASSSADASASSESSSTGLNCYKTDKGDKLYIYFDSSASNDSNGNDTYKEDYIFENGLVTSVVLETSSSKKNGTYLGGSSSNDYTYGVATYSYPNIDDMTIKGNSSSSAPSSSNGGSSSTSSSSSSSSSSSAFSSSSDSSSSK